MNEGPYLNPDLSRCHSGGAETLKNMRSVGGRIVIGAYYEGTGRGVLKPTLGVEKREEFTVIAAQQVSYVLGRHRDSLHCNVWVLLAYVP